MYAIVNKNFKGSLTPKVSKFKKSQLIRIKKSMNINNYMLFRGSYYQPKNVITKVYSNNNFYY